MAQNEIARATVYLDGKQAESALDALDKRAKQLKTDLKEAQLAGDNIRFDKVKKELAGIESAQRSVKKESFDVARVLNDINKISWRDLEKAQSSVRNQLKGMTRGTEEFANKQKDLQRITTELGNIRNAGRQTEGAFSKLTSFAKGLLPAFSFAAIAAGATAAFNQIINATDTLSTKWDIFIGGLTEGMNYFFRTVATGDWSNFFDGIERAIKLGREYQEVLDQIEANQRALTIAEADAREKALNLELKLKNKTLSKEDRIKAGDERIALEEDLAKKRTRIAEDTYNIEWKKSAEAAKMTKEQLFDVVKDFDSTTKSKAEAYNKLWEEAKKAGFTDKELRASLVIGKEYGPEVKLYADALRHVGDVTDEQLNKMVAAYVQFKEAQNSAVENVKKVITNVNTLLAGEETAGKKETTTIEKDKLKKQKEEEDQANADLKDAYNERLIIINQAYLNEEFTKEEYHVKMQVAELAYMEAQKELLKQQGKDITEIELQIVEAKIKIQTDSIEVLNQLAKKESEDILNSFEEAKKSIDESLKILEDARKKEEEENKSRRKSYADLAESIGDSFADTLMQQEIDMAQFLRNTLVMALDALEKIMILRITETIIDGTVKGPIGLAVAMGKIVLMKAAFGTAKALILGGGDKKGKQSGGYAERDNRDDTPIGIYHANEFIASAPAVRNPTIKPVLDIIDIAQRTGTIRTLNLPSEISNERRLHSSSNNSKTMDSNPSAVILDPKLEKVIFDLNETLKKGITAKATFSKYGSQGLEGAMEDVNKWRNTVAKNPFWKTER